jgi:NDP-sugar pyrophosphorylase family protein
MKDKISITLNKQLLKKVDSSIDRLFIRNRSQAIEVLLKNYLDREKQAVILFGGPEEKLMIGGQYIPSIIIKGLSLIEKTVRKLRENGFREIYIIARKKILESIFFILKTGSHLEVKIKYIEEKKSSGSASSLKLVKKEISNTFLMVYGDILFDKIKINDLWNFHLQNNSFVTLSLITFDKPSLKGEVFLDGSDIVSFNQKPKKKAGKENSYLVWCPIAVCEPEMLHYEGSSLEENIFPALAKNRLLKGYISAERETHIHSKKDLEEVNKNAKIK